MARSAMVPFEIVNFDAPVPQEAIDLVAALLLDAVETAEKKDEHARTDASVP
ncbi:hypothetical protein LCGC14_0772260 [marine sediment metagenome]|uniref:Uncharacterized protein n=1 Tax=marine sediment metagenome TaxID=412755 RepID=A0A0F9QHQ3_9ZZZZ